MPHARPARPSAIRCAECDGTGKVMVGRHGGNDPDVIERECYECWNRRSARTR